MYSGAKSLAVAVLLGVLCQLGCSREGSVKSEAKPEPERRAQSEEVKPGHYGLFLVSGSSISEMSKVTPDPSFQPIRRDYARIPSVPTHVSGGATFHFVLYGYAPDFELVPTSFERGEYSEHGESAIPLRVSPFKGEEGMYRLSPGQPLTHGTYVLVTTGCMENRYDFSCHYPFAVE
jgi:hypothetical protein